MEVNSCVKCEGIFQRNEKIIEIRGKRYCEACYKEEYTDQEESK